MSLILREYHSPRTASSMLLGGPSRRQRNKYIREIPSSLWNWTFVIPSCLRIYSLPAIHIEGYYGRLGRMSISVT